MQEVELDQEQVGVIAAIWQWGHFVNRSIESVKILSKDYSTGVKVRVRTQSGFSRCADSLLLVQYPYFGFIKDEEGKTWSFIHGDHGLEFREEA